MLTTAALIVVAVATLAIAVCCYILGYRRGFDTAAKQIPQWNGKT